MGKMLEQAVGGFASGSEEARKIARRTRIRREFLRLDGTEWDAELDGELEQEKQALKFLQDSRFACSFQALSDDDDEDREEGSDEVGEEDEWEDEDESDAENE